LNLIRVMPAKGQDHSMQTSIFLAKLIGPVMLVAAIGMLANAAAFRAMSQDFLRSPPLIFLSGLLTMTAGLAIVLYHNVWTADWRVIITLFGWAGVIGGAARIALPARVKIIGEAMLGGKPWVMTTAGVFWLVISVVLCFYGYFA
jgi:hypothetical protein